ncbi:ribonuclease P protein component [Candidatus Uhrbacteria bacterium RIFCSPHIGHO2_02_FULL_60_10]|uniref:Ribonuclease P protein component n=1 Tax=Candidatus Uhrbacteria bacterium RIFCSPHIGHO2_02_FULL_60_10 TaxID=1802392 RepID=A0A1F7U9R7_9BACT|nr:MAG: ribonuclease P protein component [Candidatus Uhrbacteria bacterium RIFCSPHIGHO2_02_FULL_60_10]
MLPLSNRLKRERDFARLFKAARAFRAPGLTIKLAPNGLPVTRVGFVVGTKVSKSAVVRNLLKRRLREIMRLLMPKIRAGADVAIITSAESAKLDFSGLRERLTTLVAKSGLMGR